MLAQSGSIYSTLIEITFRDIEGGALDPDTEVPQEGIKAKKKNQLNNVKIKEDRRIMDI